MREAAGSVVARDAVELVVRMDDGSTRYVPAPADAAVLPGSAVRVFELEDGAAIFAWDGSRRE